MAKRTTPPTASDDEVRALLDRYHCPVPFHAVRTRFLGNIASPDMQGSPIKMVEALWGGARASREYARHGARSLRSIVEERRGPTEPAHPPAEQF